MVVVLKNNKRSVLRQLLASSDTLVVVSDSTIFPTLAAGEYFYLTIVRSDGASEIVKVLSVSGASLTVVRAQEGTAAREFPVGSGVEMRVTAASVLEAAADAVDALTLGDLGVTASAAELNILDGVTATAPTLNASVSNSTQTRDTVAALLADTTLTYTAGQIGTVTAGGYVRTRSEGFSYQVAASGASDHHVTTAGGVKLYVLAGSEGYNVKAFGATGDGSTNDSTAFTTALGLGGCVYAPAGTYLINVTQMAAFTHLYGDGESTIIKPFTVGSTCLKALSSGTSVWLDGIVVRDLKLLGTVAVDGFSEFVHLLDIGGVKRFRVENVRFEGFRGDGFYLRGDVAGVQRSNWDVIVKDCTFDGANNDNRNGLSVLDVNGMSVSGCTFRNCARSTMPGSLDFEPNYSFNVIKNVRVIGNQFVNTDGNRGHVILSTQNTVELENIVIKGNHFEDVPASSAAILMNLSTTFPTTPHRIVIEGNTAEVAGANFIYKRDGDTDGVTIKGNVASSLRAVWFSTAGGAMQDNNLCIEGNTFFMESAGNGILLSETVSKISIRGNLISGTPAAHIQIGGNGTSEFVSITGNEFVGTPTSRVISHSSTTHNELTNVLEGNRFEVGHTHLFRATRSDYAGGQADLFGYSTVPSVFAPGRHMTRINSKTGPGGVALSGILYTHVRSNTVQDTYQEFVPQYSATTANDQSRYWRKALDASTWGPWWRDTGVNP